MTTFEKFLTGYILLSHRSAEPVRVREVTLPESFRDPTPEAPPSSIPEGCEKFFNKNGKIEVKTMLGLLEDLRNEIVAQERHGRNTESLRANGTSALQFLRDYPSEIEVDEDDSKRIMDMDFDFPVTPISPKPKLRTEDEPLAAASYQESLRSLPNMEQCQLPAGIIAKCPKCGVGIGCHSFVICIECGEKLPPDLLAKIPKWSRKAALP